MSERDGGPLRGIRVLDLSRVLSGPYATMLLGDLGADVIKVERPGAGDDTRAFPPMQDGESHYFLSVNRNKRSIVVDLRTSDGREVIRRLARDCDVVIENFRPGVAEQIGFGYETLKALNDRLIYCAISAFGQDGPWAGNAGFDVVIQALSGVMSVTGEPGGSPQRLGLPIGDLSGGVFAVIGVLAALHERDRTGRGQFVDVGMLDSTVGMLGYLAGRYFMTGQTPEPIGHGHHNLVPYGTFPAQDGAIVVAVLTESFWPKLCVALGRPELAADERYDSNVKRLSRREEVDTIVREALAGATVAQWCDRLRAGDVPHAPVLTVAQALASEQVRARGLVATVEHARLGSTQLLRPVIRFAGMEAPLAAAPVLGADTRTVLEEFGYPPEEIERLIAGGAVAAAHPPPVAGRRPQ
jgi:crotonobetainyl-CoA:carnitine CoA-transferase CaiB-like acyl-CoA transferase